MFPNEEGSKTDNQYKSIEANLHRDIMNVCRRYINHLSIISILGTLDMAKNETIELMRATKREISKDKPPEE